MRRRGLLFLLSGLAAAASLSTSVSTRVPSLQAGSARVDVAPSGRAWQIGNGGIALSLSVEQPDGLLRLTGLRNLQTDFNWIAAPALEAPLYVGGESALLGSATLRYERYQTGEHRGGVRLDLHFADTQRRFKAVRTYVVHPSSTVVEMWTHITPDTRAVIVDKVVAFDVPLALGTLRWITGHLNSPEAGGTFSSGWVEHEPGQRYDLGSSGRASETTVPWFAVDRGDDSVFGAYLWSGAWRLDTVRTGDVIGAALASAAIHTPVARGAAFESPHAILGVASGSVDAVAQASRDWVMSSLRQGRPFDPLVTYNTWFTYGTHIDEASMLAEIEQAAALGAEQFVLDAGWYVGVNTDPADYTAGLGSWEVDAERFPSGLGHLRDRAHELGMAFGLWVEPERVSVHTINRGRGAAERHLATAQGSYNPGVAQPDAAQVCLADAQARQWMAARLFELLDEVRPDLLKWDNNFWLACTRSTHGHTASDGAFWHVRGFTSVLQALRQRYPDMRIENCSGGGNRLSLDLLEWTDLGWMDDRSAPSSRVRHNLQGLSAAFPPAYLYSFVMQHDTEPMTDSADLPWLFRSRMPGALGLSWRGGDMVEPSRELAQREIAIYKMTRDITRDAFAVVLTAQVEQGDDSSWDVVQHVSASGASAVFAFEGRDAPERAVVRLRKLDPDRDYAIESIDYGSLGTVAGRDLMASGLELRSGFRSRAQILVLRPIQ